MRSRGDVGSDEMGVGTCRDRNIKEFLKLGRVNVIRLSDRYLRQHSKKFAWVSG